MPSQNQQTLTKTVLAAPPRPSERSNDYLFGGKELESAHDVSWYDSGARYQTTHGIFTSQDPLAEKYYSISPYAYCAGNPIYFIDDSGNDLVIVGKENSSVTFKTNLVNLSVNVSGIGVDWHGNYTLNGDDILGAALDIAGIFDPTGTADAANASLQFSQGKFGDAFVSALGIIPYAGDLAKVTRLKRDVGIITGVVEDIQYTQNLRKNMIRLTGENPANMQAHHIFPQKFKDIFWDKYHININDPHYGVWLDTHKHLSGAKAYNKEWKKFLSDHPNASVEDVMKFAEDLMAKIYK